MPGMITFQKEVEVPHITTRDYRRYPENPRLESQDFIRIHESDLKELLDRLDELEQALAIAGY